MSVGFADSSHICNEEIQLEREDRGSRSSKTCRTPFVPFCKLFGSFQTLYMCTIWYKWSGSTGVFWLPKGSFQYSMFYPCDSPCAARKALLWWFWCWTSLSFIFQEMLQTIYGFVVLFPSPHFAPAIPSRQKEATRKSLNFLALGGSWGM